MTTTETFTPEHLTKWTRPSNYAGAQWPDYYRSGCGQSRDSSALERANFDAMLIALGGEQYHDELDDPNDEGAALSLVRVVRENHWAVGWVEWIAIHESAIEQLRIADKIAGRLENHPVVDENLLSEYETEEANQVWKDCYRASERIEYIRKHRNQFEFHDFADMLNCVRGKYFAGYASELVSR
jgi:hypothetical protein